jgi:head-tail adaptor
LSLISAGQLRHRVKVLTASTSVDSYGQRSQTLTDGATIYAEVRATGASETSYGDGAAMRTTYQVRTRWRTGINAGIEATSVLEYRGDQLQVLGFVREREEEDVMLIDAVRVA